MEKRNSVKAALQHTEATVHMQQLGKTPTLGAAQTTPPVGVETAHALVASAVMRQVQHDPAVGALTLIIFLATMTSMRAAADA